MLKTTLTSAAALLLLAACSLPQQSGKHGKAGMAMATLQSASGQNVAGKVMLHEKDGHLMLHVMASGLKPGAEHGFHIHDKGDCSKADFTSAGGHFNPDNQPHGGHDHGGAKHAGDLPNVRADASGRVDQHLMAHGLALQGDKGVLGRAVVIHANPDDYHSQPAGNAGARIACGVIVAHGM
ncbi:superoxide dismutase family protein [Chitinilyticum litopenaei]|uniref:superoxide dismutase family protein n=1 Tax=Chitinilyticum litopenaei TaxID=1121276 RepID=UPI0004158B7E|nr:superoxide dismutase family protein [Chitinilyticum litopenaei]